VAALGVMLYHLYASGILGKPGSLKPFASWELPWLLPVTFGFTGVYLFFVISGFCIHLRWAKSQVTNSQTNSLDFFAFWKRRFKRLYPAYLAALALFILAEYYLGKLQLNSFFVWDLISHLLMIHNMDNRTVYSMNGVFWTLAIEEQLYLAYFLLLYLRKRFNWTVTLVVCFATRVGWWAAAFLIYRLSGIGLPVSESALSNWCVWALGAVAVEAFFGIITLPAWTRSPVVGIGTLFGAMGLYLLDWLGPQTGAGHHLLLLIMQPMWGAAFFVIVNWLMSFEFRPITGSFLARALAYVGLFSYSIYLIHELVFHIVPASETLLKILLAIAVAWLFYLVFERPFMGSTRSKKNVPVPVTGF
jgi:peptidoglycan/LPS O-acetylase OafA/YrhL